MVISERFPLIEKSSLRLIKLSSITSLLRCGSTISALESQSLSLHGGMPSLDSLQVGKCVQYNMDGNFRTSSDTFYDQYSSKRSNVFAVVLISAQKKFGIIGIFRNI